MRFVKLDEVLVIHDRMLEIGGGGVGIHDFTLLHSAIERPKAQFAGNYLYSSIWDMAAAFLQSMVKNHPFDDGNKRTAYFSTKRFLQLNGYLLEPKDNEVIKFMISVDVKDLTLEQISGWLRQNSKRISKKNSKKIR